MVIRQQTIVQNQSINQPKSIADDLNVRIREMKVKPRITLWVSRLTHHTHKPGVNMPPRLETPEPSVSSFSRLLMGLENDTKREQSIEKAGESGQISLFLFTRIHGRHAAHRKPSITSALGPYNSRGRSSYKWRQFPKRYSFVQV